MAVVKADGYGHGLVPSARAVLEGGAAWLGVAFLEEATRSCATPGIDAPLLAWLWSPQEDLAPAVAAGVDLGVYDLAELAAVQAAARATGRTARVHLKVDTGLSRGGSRPEAWPELCAAAARTEGVEAVGVWSHFAFADGGPDHPVNGAQAARVRRGARGGRARRRPAAGAPPRQLRRDPDRARHPLRPRAARACSLYGLSPVPQLGSPADFGLRPAMTLDEHRRAGQAGAGGHRRELPAPLRRPTARPRWRSCRSATPTGCRGRGRPAAGAARRPPPHGRGHRLHGPVRARRRRRRRRRRATRCCCSARATTASRRRRSGRTCWAPSTTRSSRRVGARVPRTYS